MAKDFDEVPVGENLAEHLLDLIGGAGVNDIVIDPGDPGYKEVTWRKSL